MPAVARAVSPRELTDGLAQAVERRPEVLDVIVDSDDRASAVHAIADLLGTSPAGCEAVIGMSLDQLTKDSRNRIADELEDLNKELTFTHGDRPARPGQTMTLTPFARD